jgi:Putative Flp pilus-assembly TadE/G-like
MSGSDPDRIADAGDSRTLTLRGLWAIRRELAGDTPIGGRSAAMWWRRGGSEQGSVAVTVALAITVLLGFAALVVDIGLNWAARTSAQTAADSAALAGASTLLADGGAAALLTVNDALTDNGIALPGVVNWATDGNEGNGEVVCWTLPAGAPGPGANCPDGSNALQVTTPAIEVEYAFAPLLGEATRSIKARAAAAAGPAAPNNCVLCVLDLGDDAALAATGAGGIEVDGGGIVVNSNDAGAVLLTGGGIVRADQIRVVGGIDLPISGSLLPPAETGGPPVPNPLADLPSPGGLPIPPTPDSTPVRDITTDTILTQGVYESITVNDGATLTLEEGVYVVTDFSPSTPGFRVNSGGRVEGEGATIYLACEGYPAPCDGDAGTRFRLDPGSEFDVSPPTSGAYAGLSIFADSGNTRSQQLRGDVTLAGAVYAASARLVVFLTANVQVDSLVAVDRLTAASLDTLRVNYDPSLSIFGYGVPVLIS